MSTRIAAIIMVAMVWALMAGCAEINSIRSGIGMYGQQASDGALHDSLWAICKATPVGAIKRKFNTLEKLRLYDALCSDQELLTEAQ